MGQILVIDNYDSFTYNLVEQVRNIAGIDPEVKRNDDIQLDSLGKYSHVILSPGPGIPNEAGLMPQALRIMPSKVKVLGVCLGHQCLGEVFGATLSNLSQPMHAKSTPISVIAPGHKLFLGLPNSFNVGRYHSWVVDNSSIPDCLECLAVDQAGQCMALSHKTHPFYGVQFHPESVLSEHGYALMRNFLEV